MLHIHKQCHTYANTSMRLKVFSAKTIRDKLSSPSHICLAWGKPQPPSGSCPSALCNSLIRLAITSGRKIKNQSEESCQVERKETDKNQTEYLRKNYISASHNFLIKYDCNPVSLINDHPGWKYLTIWNLFKREVPISTIKCNTECLRTSINAHLYRDAWTQERVLDHNCGAFL